MSWVKAKPGESFESLIRRFRKAVERSGVLADYRKNEFYEKPSVKRKRKQAAARKRAAKKAKQMARFKSRTPSGQNFRWNDDRTKKLPMKPSRPKSEYNQRPGNRPKPAGNGGAGNRTPRRTGPNNKGTGPNRPYNNKQSGGNRKPSTRGEQKK